MNEKNKGGRPLKYKTVEELQEAINNYFEDADLRSAPYTIEGICYWLEIDRKTLINYQERDKFFHTIKKAKDKVLMQLQEIAISGQGNATSIIFNLKNNYNYTDKQEIKQETKDTSKEVKWWLDGTDESEA